MVQLSGGAVVTHDVPPYAVVAGNLARIIKYRFTEEKREKLEKTEWWNFSPDQIMNGYHCFDNVDLFCEEIQKINSKW